MATFLRTVLAQDESITVSTRVTYDLPVNPLSHILFTLKFLNDTVTLTNFSTVVAALNQIALLTVDFKGSSVISLSFKDLAVLSQLLLRLPIGQNNLVKTDNDVRSITVIIPFGRSLYNPRECFPASRRGDLRLIIDYAGAQAGIDNLVAQIETVELPDATPEFFLKATKIEKTMVSGVGNDVDLPIGNDILGVLLFGTTTPTGASYNATLGKIKVLLDNVEAYYNDANWETLHAEFKSKMRMNLENSDHKHVLGGTGAAGDDTYGVQNDADYLENYAYLDFDPDGSMAYVLATEGRARVHLRISAEAGDAARIIPVEIIKVGAGA